MGDRSQAALEEPLIVDDNVVAAKGADVSGRWETEIKDGLWRDS
jgi:hypothetical protein